MESFNKIITNKKIVLSIIAVGVVVSIAIVSLFISYLYGSKSNATKPDKPLASPSAISEGVEIDEKTKKQMAPWEEPKKTHDRNDNLPLIPGTILPKTSNTIVFAKTFLPKIMSHDWTSDSTSREDYIKKIGADKWCPTWETIRNAGYPYQSSQKTFKEVCDFLPQSIYSDHDWAIHSSVPQKIITTVEDVKIMRWDDGRAIVKNYPKIQPLMMSLEVGLEHTRVKVKTDVYENGDLANTTENYYYLLTHCTEKECRPIAIIRFQPGVEEFPEDNAPINYPYPAEEIKTLRLFKQ